jgi:hypothetical protein
MEVKRQVSRQEPAPLAPGTTLPIQFERSVDSTHEHAGSGIAAMMTRTFEVTIPRGIFLAYWFLSLICERKSTDGLMNLHGSQREPAEMTFRSSVCSARCGHPTPLAKQ